MGLWISIVIGIVIFAFVLRQIMRFIHLGSRAKCEHCGYKKECSGSDCSIKLDQITRISRTKK